MPVSLSLMLVEDSSDDVFMFMRAAGRALPKFQITVVGDGDEAREALTSGPSLPDLIVTDLKMPRWNGYDLITWLRGEPNFRNIPLCVLTSSPEPKDVEKTYALGVNLFLVKPIGYLEYADLLEAIRLFWEHPQKLPQNRFVRSPSGSSGNTAAASHAR